MRLLWELILPYAPGDLDLGTGTWTSEGWWTSVIMFRFAVEPRYGGHLFLLCFLMGQTWIASDAPTNIFDLNVVLALCFVSCFAGGGEIMILL